MASIQRRISKDGTETFRVGYRQAGKLRWTGAFADADGAVEMKNLIERQGPDVALATLRVRSGRDVVRSAPLLRDWFEQHLALLGADATPGTIKDYRALAARTWLPILGALPLDSITRESVIEWVAWQRKQPTARGKGTYSAKSIKNAHGLLSGTLASAVEHEKGIVKNVARGVGLPTDDADKEMEVFTDDEWDRFVQHLDPHYLPLVRFLLTVGCRIGEATAVKVKDVDLARETVRIQRAWKKGDSGVYLGSTKTRRGKRTVVLSAPVVEDLGKLVTGRDPDALVFVGKQGGRIQAQHFRNRQWSHALAAAGIMKPLTPHSLRHTGASALLANGVSAIVVQHRLGHESLATTSKVYAHLLTDAQLGAAQVMERALGRKQIGGSAP